MEYEGKTELNGQHMKHEYHEGKLAADSFEKMAMKVFRAPKSSVKPVAKNR
jgi:hypothetical protein